MIGFKGTTYACLISSAGLVSPVLLYTTFGMASKDARGKFLTALLAYYFLALLLVGIPSVISPNWIHIRKILGITMPTEYVVWKDIGFFLQVLIFLGLLQWKKIAVYGLFLYPEVQVLGYFAIFRPLSNPKPPLFDFLVGTGIPAFIYLLFWLLAIKRKWHLFT